MRRESFNEIQKILERRITSTPDFKNKSTYECLQLGFVLTNPLNNKNDRSNYDYAEDFFQWILTGNKELSKEVVDHNPWVKRFMDTSGLPENFSASYAERIMSQIDYETIKELSKPESRRAYVSILDSADRIIWNSKTTHEYPCTIGLHPLVRDGKLHMIANMRSNNVYRVLPYDVYNFTRLQHYIAGALSIPLGNYYHQMNSAHIFVGDVNRILNNLK